MSRSNVKGLNEKKLKVNILDMGLFFILDFSPPLRVSFAEEEADAEIAGELTDLLDVFLGRADGDALFFAGKIKMTGAAALLVELRNNLEQFDITELKRRLGPVGEALWN